MWRSRVEEQRGGAPLNAGIQAWYAAALLNPKQLGLIHYIRSACVWSVNTLEGGGTHIYTQFNGLLGRDIVLSGVSVSVRKQTLTHAPVKSPNETHREIKRKKVETRLAGKRIGQKR